MKKFAVCSGFLGAGKTSLMIALSRYYTDHYGKAAMISNDLGGSGLADHRLAMLSGCNASEIAGECICFCHEVLAGILRSYYSDGFDLILSDIPGFGVGALEHVYHGMEKDYPGEFTFAPFLCVIEPDRAKVLCSDAGGDMIHILNAQMMEADLIVLNKCDLLEHAEMEDLTVRLSEKYPQTEVIAASALTGYGLSELSSILKEQTASMHHPDIIYEAPALQNELGSMSEYYIQYRAEVCCDDFDGSSYLQSLAQHIQNSFILTKYEIPHMKVLAWSPDGDYGKADLLGKDRPVCLSHRFSNPCVDLAVVINATASCPHKTLDSLISSSVEEVSSRFQLECITFRKQCFGMEEDL